VRDFSRSNVRSIAVDEASIVVGVVGVADEDSLKATNIHFGSDVEVVMISAIDDESSFWCLVVDDDVVVVADDDDKCSEVSVVVVGCDVNCIHKHPYDFDVVVVVLNGAVV